MEDSVTENEKLQVLTVKQGAAEEVINNGEDVQDKPAVGFINQLISSFAPVGEEGKDQEEKDMGDKLQGKQERDDDGGDHVVEDKPVGFINQIISSFAPGDHKDQVKEEEIDNKVSSVESEEKQEENRGGGLFSHIISNLVSSPVSSPRARDGKSGVDLFDNAKTPEKDGNGIIDNIVSNLPPPLPDDAAPASDEASILIHSIIHD